MTQSMTRQLFLKDLELIRVPAICYWLAGLATVALAMFSGLDLGLAASILFISALAAAGIHPIMQSVVMERENKTLAFMMSLPITIKEYTLAKMSANLLAYSAVWVTLSAASFAIFIGDAMPRGTIPMMTIVLVGIYVAYVAILATSVASESLAWCIAMTIIANLGTQILMWWIAGLYGIRSFVNGPEAVWNSTVITVLAAQLLAIVLMVVATFVVQSRKKDFVI